MGLVKLQKGKACVLQRKKKDVDCSTIVEGRKNLTKGKIHEFEERIVEKAKDKKMSQSCEIR